MPRNPSSPMRRSTSRGTKPCSSQAPACGLISVSTKRRSWARSISCSSRKYAEGLCDEAAACAAGLASMNLAKPLTRQGGTAAERHELRGRDLAAHRRHAAIGAGDDAFLGHVFHYFADGRGDFFRGLDLIGRHIDHADQHVLAVEQREEARRHMRVAALDRYLVDAACRERRKDRLVLPPFAAERRLPVDVGLDAVAVTDVDRRGAG